MNVSRNNQGISTVDSKQTNFKMYRRHKSWFFASAMMLSMMTAGMMNVHDAKADMVNNAPKTELQVKSESASKTATTVHSTAASTADQATSSANNQVTQASNSDQSVAEVHDSSKTTASSVASSDTGNKMTSRGTSSIAKTDPANKVSQTSKTRAKNESASSTVETDNKMASAKASSSTKSDKKVATSSAAKATPANASSTAPANNSQAGKQNSSSVASQANINPVGVDTVPSTNQAQGDINKDAAAKAGQIAKNADQGKNVDTDNKQNSAIEQQVNAQKQVNKDNSVVPYPGMDPVTAGDRIIHGEGINGYTITIYVHGGIVGHTRVDFGRYVFRLPEDITIYGGDIVMAVQTDHNGNSSGGYEVIAGYLVASPELNTPEDGDRVITGKGTWGDIVKIYDDESDALLGTVEVGKSGHFLMIAPKPIKANQRIYARQYDKEGNNSDRSLTVTATKVGIYTPQVGSLVIQGATKVSGLGQVEGHVITITDVSTGMVIGRGIVDETWHFTVVLYYGLHLVTGQVISITESDHKGHTSAPDTETVTEYPPVNDNSKLFTGNGAKPNALIKIYDTRKELIATGRADKNGNFNIPIPNRLDGLKGDDIKKFSVKQFVGGKEIFTAKKITIKIEFAPSFKKTISKQEMIRKILGRI